MFIFCFAILGHIYKILQYGLTHLQTDGCTPELLFFLSLGIGVLTQLLHTQLQTAPVHAEGEETNRTMSSAKARVQYGVTHRTDFLMQLHPEILRGCAKHDCICCSVLVEAHTHWVHVLFHAEIIYTACIAALHEQKTFKPNTPEMPCTSSLWWFHCELSTTLQNTFRKLKVSH